MLLRNSWQVLRKNAIVLRKVSLDPARTQTKNDPGAKPPDRTSVKSIYLLYSPHLSILKAHLDAVRMTW